MGMFKRAKKTKERKAVPVVAGGSFTDEEADAVKALWRLTALPREEFDATYGELLRRSWRCIANAPGGECAALREGTLASAIAALKVRRAHVLPRFAAAEDSSRLAEVMSFALAACVVAERFALVLGRAAGPNWCPMADDVPAGAKFADVAVPRSFGALVLPRLLGAAGHKWLGQQPEALRELAAYFGGGPSQLRAIGDDAAARIGMPVVPLAPETPASGAGRDGKTPTARPTAVAETPAQAVASAAGQADGDVSGTEPASTGAPSANVGGADASTPARGPSDIGDGRVGWQWFNWVRAGLRDGSVQPNAEGGWLHNIDGTAYVVDPDGFEELAAAESTPPKSIRNRVLKLGKHRTRRSEAGRADAFPAELADGRRVSGMLFDGDLFWDKDAPPASKSTLR